MIDFLMWLCNKTGHLIKTKHPEKSEGLYKHCQICGALIKEKNND
jgi:hypothetical protein